MPVTAAQAAARRAELGLSPDPVSDAKWERWTREGSRTVEMMEAALWDKAAREGTLRGGSGATGDAGARQDNPAFQQPAPAPAPATPTPAPTPAVDFAKIAAGLYPWLPDPLLDIFKRHYTDSGGDAGFAMGMVRQSSEYEIHYPGNRREDGQLRYSEEGYSRQIEGYDRAFAFYGIPAGSFEGRYGELVAGGVDSDALFRRLDTVYTRVFSQGDRIRQFYAESYGGNFSTGALMGSAIDPSLSPSELELRISRAEVGGAIEESGFDVDLDDATRLQMAGLDLEAARNVARRAQGVLPNLNELVQRHNDPGDPFDFMDYADATVLADDETLGRMRRLVGQEAGTFTGQGLSRQDEQGRVTGIRQS